MDDTRDVTQGWHLVKGKWDFGSYGNQPGRPPMPNRVSMTIGLEQAQRDALVALAFQRSVERGRMVSVSALIREAVADYISPQTGTVVHLPTGGLETMVPE